MLLCRSSRLVESQGPRLDLSGCFLTLAQVAGWGSTNPQVPRGAHTILPLPPDYFYTLARLDASASGAQNLRSANGANLVWGSRPAPSPLRFPSYLFHDVARLDSDNGQSPDAHSQAGVSSHKAKQAQRDIPLGQTLPPKAPGGWS